MRGQFSPWLRLWRCGDQAGDRVGKTQQHRVVVGDEDIAHAVGARAGGEQRKAAPEERMGGIGDLDFRRIVSRRVVDRGIKVFNRSIGSTIRPYWPKFKLSPAFADNSKLGFKRVSWKEITSVRPQLERPRAAVVHRCWR